MCRLLALLRRRAVGPYGRRRIGRAPIDSLPDCLRARRIARQRPRRRVQSSHCEAPTLQDRVASGRALRGVESRSLVDPFQIGHHGHEGRVADAARRLPTATGRGHDEDDDHEMPDDDRDVHVAARLDGGRGCVKRA